MHPGIRLPSPSTPEKHLGSPGRVDEDVVDEECGLGDEAGGWFLPG